jgi:hypothetical protein
MAMIAHSAWHTMKEPAMSADTASITIRPAYADDDAVLRRLAALDSAPVPSRPALLAEVDGEARAALSLTTGAAVADPFHLTQDLVELLRTRAQATPERRPTRSPRYRLRLA